MNDTDPRTKELRGQTEHCFRCNADRRLTGKTKITNKVDPTEAYQLTCGHWVI